jgi:hypothetical protein
MVPVWSENSADAHYSLGELLWGAMTIVNTRVSAEQDTAVFTCGGNREEPRRIHRQADRGF